MHQTSKGKQWHHRCSEGFASGLKVHIGVDKDSVLIHSVVGTAANVHDLTPAVLVSEDKAARHGQESLQDQRARSPDESVPGEAPATCDAMRAGQV